MRTWGYLAALTAGLIFAFGLGVSGMTDANKVIGFLDLSGDWDPSLAFVMVGAIGVHLSLSKLVFRRERPIFAAAFQIPKQSNVDGPLIMGAGLFGVGWGLGGFCPGPGLVSVVSAGSSASSFVAAMLVGMVFHHLLHGPMNATRSRS